MTKISPEQLSASEAARLMAKGELTSEQLVTATLERIEARDGIVHAWAHVAAERALAKARACDREERRSPLHGIPVGIKDVIDTRDMPTQYGAEAFKGFQPQKNARCIELLEEAGMVILGKTVTAEFATYHPGPTANPHDPTHTPGGSSSGSAAAVADFQVPFALGTQTAGSIVRPASFCGVYGFKPSFGRYDTGGMSPTSHHLDTLGGFARSVEDLDLLDAVLSEKPQQFGFAATRPARLGLCRSAEWPEAGDEVKALFDAATATLRGSGVVLHDIDLGPDFQDLAEHQKIIHQREAADLLGPIYDQHKAGLSETLGRFIEGGRAIPDARLEAALEAQSRGRARIGEIFCEVDLILTPSAPGPAPSGLGATGNPVFNRVWTLLGTPVVNMPLGKSKTGLPIGLQAVGAIDHDRLMLAMAAWLDDYLATELGRASKERKSA